MALTPATMTADIHTTGFVNVGRTILWAVYISGFFGDDEYGIIFDGNPQTAGTVPVFYADLKAGRTVAEWEPPRGVILENGLWVDPTPATPTGPRVTVVWSQ